MAEDVIGREAVVWFDPGRVTGWAALVGDRFFSDQMQSLGKLDAFFESWFTDHGAATLTVGWERYLVTPGGGKSGTPHWALEAIGNIQGALARTAEAHPDTVTILPAMPASARAIAGTRVLKELRWYRAGRTHANDAAMHLAAYLLRARPVPQFLLDVFTKLLDVDMVELAHEAP